LEVIGEGKKNPTGKEEPDERSRRFLDTIKNGAPRMRKGSRGARGAERGDMLLLFGCGVCRKEKELVFEECRGSKVLRSK